MIALGLIFAVLGVATACDPQPIGTSPAPAKVWTLPVQVEMPQTLVAKYGGPDPSMASKVVKGKVEDQLSTVASNFVGFNASLRLIVTYHEFVTTPHWNEFQQSQVAHPAGTLLIAYSETKDPDRGGWDGETFSIYHRFLDTDLGVFGFLATNGLTHELGHVFGAVDLYKLNVNAVNNPISHTDYTVPLNYMSEPYYHPGWDAYTVGIINKADGHITYHGGEVTSSLPQGSKLIAKTTGGTAVGSASIKMYPVNWGSYSVSPTPFYTGLTSSDGSWTLPSNPFGAGTPGNPWDVRTPNYLIEVKSGANTGYAWMSILDAGTFYFEHPTSIYQVPVTVG